MEKNEIKHLIQEQILCRIAFKGKEYPYIAPFQYKLMDGKLYFHFTNYGKKMKLLEKDNRVCVEIEMYLPDLSEYCFVTLRGNLKIVMDHKERERVIEKMAEDGKEELSNNFLAVHGIDPIEDWRSFTPKKPFVIVMLEDIVEVVGLKSPA